MIQVLPPGAPVVDVVATNYIRGYQIPGGVADRLFPRVPVGRQTGKYLTDVSDQALQVPAQLERAPGTRPQQVGVIAPTMQPYSLPSRALTTPVADEDEAAYQFGSLAESAATINQNRMMTAREIRFAGKVQNPANYPVNNTLALSGNAQIDSALSDPSTLLVLQKVQVPLDLHRVKIVMLHDKNAASTAYGATFCRLQVMR